MQKLVSSVAKQAVKLYHFSYPDWNTMFFVTSEHDQLTDTTTVAFESVKFRGRYLVMDSRKGKLRLGIPKDGNQHFGVVLTPSPIYIALRDNRGCYVGFNSTGDRLPCGLQLRDPQDLLFLRLVDTSLGPKTKS